jgi:hypothetical protein
MECLEMLGHASITPPASLRYLWLVEGLPCPKTRRPRSDQIGNAASAARLKMSPADVRRQ